MSISAVCNVVLEGGSQDKVFNNQVAIQSPNELIRFSGLRVGFAKAMEEVLDEGMVLFDYGFDARHVDERCLWLRVSSKFGAVMDLYQRVEGSCCCLFDRARRLQTKTCKQMER
jgi:hypothetical protein